jgi:hypothetical protein
MALQIFAGRDQRLPCHVEQDVEDYTTGKITQEDYDITGMTLHFSVIESDRREILHVTQDTHVDPTTGHSVLILPKSQTKKLKRRENLHWELSIKNGGLDMGTWSGGPVEIKPYYGTI